MDALSCAIAGLAGAGAGYALRELVARLRVGSAREQAQELVEAAVREGETRAAQARTRLEAELEARRREASEREVARETELAAAAAAAAERERELERRLAVVAQQEAFAQETRARAEQGEALVAAREKQLEAQLAFERKELERIGRMDAKEAEELLLTRLARDVQAEMATVVVREVARVEAEVDERARAAILVAIQRLAVEHTADHVVSTVDIPNDEMKGRIIGREGRNIRAFEQATGVDVIIDDTPGVVVVSGFDCLRREVARRAMEKLTIDGRIHPARIEEVVAATRREVSEIVLETGRAACYELNVHGVHPKLVALLGQLQYRTSLGQNILEHSVQVAQIAGLLASELKLDRQLARRAGLLHDVGKAADVEVDGSHARAGADLARRCDEPAEVANAIAAHHGEVPPETPYAILVQIANQASRARPARQGTLDAFIERMEKLETLAGQFEGVATAHAIRAGREVRVIVDPVAISDERAVLLCREIARAIKDALSFPNELRVTVLRESRAVEYSM